MLNQFRKNHLVSRFEENCYSFLDSSELRERLRDFRRIAVASFQKTLQKELLKLQKSEWNFLKEKNCD